MSIAWWHRFSTPTGGKISGTARWFASTGMRPPMVHAWVATLTELGCGVMLAVGVLVPLAAGGVLGTMLVALVTVHLKNGFFIFRPGEGYEYVLMISIVAVALAGLGGGYLSIDHAIDLPIKGWSAFVLCIAPGIGGAALTLLSSWRSPKQAPEPAEEPGAL